MAGLGPDADADAPLRTTSLAHLVAYDLDPLGLAADVDADALLGPTVDDLVSLHAGAVAGERTALVAEQDADLAAGADDVAANDVVGVAVADRDPVAAAVVDRVPLGDAEPHAPAEEDALIVPLARIAPDDGALASGTG